MAQVRCRYCHDYLEAWELPAHEAEHLKLRPDGQQSEYVTLPPEERESSDQIDVPQVYVHRKCGTPTGMPEEIIRSYLKNPYLYTADATFCCGCHRHVPWRECNWVESNEDLQTYFGALRACRPEMRPNLLKRVLIAVATRLRQCSP